MSHISYTTYVRRVQQTDDFQYWLWFYRHGTCSVGVINAGKHMGKVVHMMGGMAGEW
jgi:hypothetical protein